MISRYLVGQFLRGRALKLSAADALELKREYERETDDTITVEHLQLLNRLRVMQLIAMLSK